MTEATVPAFSLESERAVISSCVLHGAGIVEQVRTLVRAEDFYDPAHKHTFAAVLSLYDREIPLDLDRILVELRERGQGDEVTAKTIVKTVQATPSVGHPESHARVINRYARQRRAVSEAHKVLGELSSPHHDLDQYLTTVSASYAALAYDQSQHGLVPIASVLDPVKDLLIEAQNSDSPIRGVASELDDLDQLTTGFHPGDVTVVAGRTSMGKSAFVLNVARCLGFHPESGAVAYFSTEMPKEQLAIRLLAQEARVDMQRLRCGTLRPADWSKITQAMEKFQRSAIYLDDTSSISPHDVHHRMLLLDREIRSGKHPGVAGGVRCGIVDYLQQMRPPERRTSRQEEVGDISKSLKRIAKDLHLHVFAVSQVNREPEKNRKDKRPSIAELRNSGEIEQDADNIILIYRDEYYNEDTVDKGIAEINVAKQRNGPTDTVKVKWTGAYGRFDNLSHDVPPEALYEPDSFSDFFDAEGDL
jgi:replicative DNA helicase